MDSGTLAPANDVLWSWDQLSWPPELQGSSLAKLPKEHDPAHGGDSFKLVNNGDVELGDDDDLESPIAKQVIETFKKELEIEKMKEQDNSAEVMKEVHTAPSEVKKKEEDNTEKGEEEEVELKEVEIDPLDRPRVDAGIYFFDLTFDGMLPLFLGRIIGIAVMLNLIAIIKLMRPMSPHRRYFGHLLNLLQSTAQGLRAMFVSWRHRPKRRSQDTEASSFKVV